MAQNDTPKLPVKFKSVAVGDLGPAEKREYRARTQRMTIVPERDPEGEATGMYRVATTSRSQYRVDIVNGVCTCKDYEYNRVAQERGCKHIQRILIEITEGDAPARGEPTDDFMERLGEQREALQKERKKHLDAVDSLNALIRPLERLEK